MAPTPLPTTRRAQQAGLVVRVHDATLFRRLDRIRAALAGLPFVAPVPDHCLHLPVLDLGPVASRSRRAGELTRPDIVRVGHRARALLAELPAFAIDLARVNADEFEVFAEIHPPDALGELHDALEEIAPPETRPPGFLPRFPLAHFRAAGSARALGEALEWFRDRPIGRVRVDAVTVALSSTRVLHPRLDRVLEAPLSRPEAG